MFLWHPNLFETDMCSPNFIFPKNHIQKVLLFYWVWLSWYFKDCKAMFQSVVEVEILRLKSNQIYTIKCYRKSKHVLKRIIASGTEWLQFWAPWSWPTFCLSIRYATSQPKGQKLEEDEMVCDSLPPTTVTLQQTHLKHTHPPTYMLC